MRLRLFYCLNVYIKKKEYMELLFNDLNPNIKFRPPLNLRYFAYPYFSYTWETWFSNLVILVYLYRRRQIEEHGS